MSATPFAIVQHGNQALITDGYDNREGIGEILQGFAAILALHLKYRTPLNLHLSGTLIEAAAWHAPDFFLWVKRLHGEGLLELIGSSYAQNIMPLFSMQHNLRQFNTAFGLYERHLGIGPDEVRTAWLPERVWHTGRLAPLVQSAALRNHGFHTVLLDERLIYPLNGDYARSPRRQFDERFGGGSYPPTLCAERLPAEGRAPAAAVRIANTDDLLALPIRRELRYCIPPCEDGHWRMLEALVERVSESGEAIHVYADDLEKCARVGPWGSRPWTVGQTHAYEQFLAWLSGHPRLKPVLISPWLESHPPVALQTVEPGTYYELAQPMGAGEDYQQWWHSAAFAPYREMLLAAERDVACAQDAYTGAGDSTLSPLRALAWKQLMACSYETAWQERGTDGRSAPAPWALALASHARATHVISAAARWAEQRDSRARATLVDIDCDGEEEIVMCNDALYAVICPRYGGRLVYLFDLTSAGSLVVGNPADDWNWQAELNRCMDVPRNHLGAFADVGHENDVYEVLEIRKGLDEVCVRLLNAQPGSPLQGRPKTFRLSEQSHHLVAAYHLPPAAVPLRIDFCLSPNYLSLLEGGREGLARIQSDCTRGWRNCDVSVAVRKDAAAPLVWEEASPPECGHGLIVRLAAYGPRFELAVGLGCPKNS
jgi:hypothetical protein